MLKVKSNCIKDVSPIDAIVSREVWEKTQKILDKMNYKSWKQDSQQRLIPLEKGILKGFISISPKWKDVSLTRLKQATEKVLNNEGGQIVELVEEKSESEDFVMSDVLKGFEVIDIEIGRSDSVMTVMGNMLKFNKATATELMYPTYARMLIDAANKQVAIQACSDKTRNSVAFSKGEGNQVYAITVKVPAIVVAIRKLIPGIGKNESLTFKGKLFAEDKAIIYDVTAGESVKRRGKRKDQDEDSDTDADVERVDESSEDPEDEAVDAAMAAEADESSEVDAVATAEPVDENPAPKKRGGRRKKQ